MTSFLFYYMILLVLRQVFIVILSWKSLQDFTLGTFYLNAFISIFFIEDGVLKPVNIREKIPSPICCFFPSLLSSSRPLLFKLNIPLFPLNFEFIRAVSFSVNHLHFMPLLYIYCHFNNLFSLNEF